MQGLGLIRLGRARVRAGKGTSNELVSDTTSFFGPGSVRQGWGWVGSRGGLAKPRTN